MIFSSLKFGLNMIHISFFRSNGCSIEDGSILSSLKSLKTLILYNCPKLQLAIDNICKITTLRSVPPFLYLTDPIWSAAVSTFPHPMTVTAIAIKSLITRWNKSPKVCPIWLDWTSQAQIWPVRAANTSLASSRATTGLSSTSVSIILPMRPPIDDRFLLLRYACLN